MLLEKNFFSIILQVSALTNDLRRAASAIFRATARINNEIDLGDVLDCLEEEAIREEAEATRQQEDDEAEVSDDVEEVYTAKSAIMDIPEAAKVNIKVGGVATDEVGSMSMSASTVAFSNLSGTSSWSCMSMATSPSEENLLDDVAEEEKEPEENKPNALPTISLSEVSQHYTSDDAWIVFYDKVYDVTDFLDEVKKNCMLKRG